MATEQNVTSVYFDQLSLADFATLLPVFDPRAYGVNIPMEPYMQDPRQTKVVSGGLVGFAAGRIDQYGQYPYTELTQPKVVRSPDERIVPSGQDGIWTGITSSFDQALSRLITNRSIQERLKGHKISTGVDVSGNAQSVYLPVGKSQEQIVTELIQWQNYSIRQSFAYGFGLLCYGLLQSSVSVPYQDLSDTHNLTLPHIAGAAPTPAWTDHVNATPLEDIQGWVDQLKSGGGFKARAIVMGRTAAAHFKLCEQVTKSIYTFAQYPLEVSNSLLTSIPKLQDLGISVIVVDEEYPTAYTNGHPSTYTDAFPADKIALVGGAPGAPVGRVFVAPPDLAGRIGGGLTELQQIVAQEVGGLVISITDSMLIGESDQTGQIKISARGKVYVDKQSPTLTATVV